MPIRIPIFALASLALVACAGNEVEPPTDQLGVANSAMERAAQANAYEFAAFEMATANRKLLRAKELAESDEDDDRREAEQLAEQVTADARLAEAKARMAEAKALNAEARRTLEELRQQSKPETGEIP